MASDYLMISPHHMEHSKNTFISLFCNTNLKLNSIINSKLPSHKSTICEMQHLLNFLLPSKLPRTCLQPSSPQVRCVQLTI